MNEMPEDICVTDVTKIFKLGLFKSKIGVENLTFGVPRGQVIGLLGPNGAGKSTTIKMLLGFLRPTRGEILVCGHPATEQAARSFIGYLPESPRFQKFLTAEEVLRYYGGLLSLTIAEVRARADYLLDLVNLKHARRERVQGFSKGMTQRLAIAQSLLHNPRILIFDEPMSGLDPLGRMEIRKLIAQVHEELPQSTILFSTHILGDVEELCSLVAVLRNGRLATYCPIESLLAANAERFDVVVREIPNALKDRYSKEFQSKTTPLGVSFTIEGTDLLIERLTEMRRFGVVIVGVSSHRRTLEEALFKEGELPSIAPPPQLQAGAGL